MRGATTTYRKPLQDCLDFNPRAPCGARPCAFLIDHINANISTHAPLAGRDSITLIILICISIFQPTRPLRGATYYGLVRRYVFYHFNPRAPCGARPGGRACNTPTFLFQPTRPLRGATDIFCSSVWIETISTHAPLAGRDSSIWVLFLLLSIFQPTRPLRGATIAPVLLWNTAPFQPTRPLRGATRNLRALPLRNSVFQPTRPLRGATFVAFGMEVINDDFNPRAPCGARPIPILL